MPKNFLGMSTKSVRHQKRELKELVCIDKQIVAQDIGIRPQAINKKNKVGSTILEESSFASHYSLYGTNDKDTRSRDPY